MAFVTFNCQEGYERMVKYCSESKNILGIKDKKKKYLNLHGHNLYMDKAPEPSDLIWENLAVNPFQKRLNAKKMYFIIFFVLLIIFIIFGALKQLSRNSAQIASTYGKDCQ